MHTWFKPLRFVELTSAGLVVSLSSEDTKLFEEWINRHYGDLLCDAMIAAGLSNVRLILVPSTGEERAAS